MTCLIEELEVTVKENGILNFLLIKKLELPVHVLGTVAQSFLRFWPYITDFVGVRYHIILSVKLLHMQTHR